MRRNSLRDGEVFPGPPHFRRSIIGRSCDAEQPAHDSPPAEKGAANPGCPSRSYLPSTHAWAALPYRATVAAPGPKSRRSREARRPSIVDEGCTISCPGSPPLPSGGASSSGRSACPAPVPVPSSCPRDGSPLRRAKRLGRGHSSGLTICVFRALTVGLCIGERSLLEPSLPMSPNASTGAFWLASEHSGSLAPLGTGEAWATAWDGVPFGSLAVHHARSAPRREERRGEATPPNAPAALGLEPSPAHRWRPPWDLC